MVLVMYLDFWSGLWSAAVALSVLRWLTPRLCLCLPVRRAAVFRRGAVMTVRAKQGW